MESEKKKNNIFTLNGFNIIHAAEGHGQVSSGDQSTLVRIDLSDAFHKDWFVKQPDANDRGDGSSDAGDAPFYYQLRELLAVRKEISRTEINDPDLLKDKIVIVDFENFFAEIKYVQEGDYGQYSPDYDGSYHPDLSLKTRDILKAFDIRFDKDSEFRRFVSFDKSQSMARHGKILYIDEKYLSGTVNAATVSLNSPDGAEYVIRDWFAVIKEYGADVFDPGAEILGPEISRLDRINGRIRECPDSYLFDAVASRIRKRRGLKETDSYVSYSFKCNDLVVFDLKETVPYKAALIKDSDITEYHRQNPNFQNMKTDKQLLIEASVARYKESAADGTTLFENIPDMYYPEPVILSENDSRVYFVGKDLFDGEEDFKSFAAEVKKQRHYIDWCSKYLDKRLMLGLDFSNTSLAFSKLYAYRGLYLSTSIRMPDIELNEDTVVVLDDSSLSFEETLPCVTNEENESKAVEKNKLLKIKSMFDGEGLICPEYARKINSNLSDKKYANSFQIRMPFMKGMLHMTDFHKFLRNYLGKDRKNVFVKDYFGRKRDLMKARIILMPSMFKGAEWLKEMCDVNTDPMKLFFDRVNALGHALYISGTDIPYRGRKYTTMNYQFLNTLKLTKDDLYDLVKEHCRFIEDPLLNIQFSKDDHQNNEEDQTPDDGNGQSYGEPDSDSELDIDIGSLDESGEDAANAKKAKTKKNDDKTGNNMAAERWVSLLRLASEKQQKELASYEPVREALQRFSNKRTWDIAKGRLQIPGEIRYLSRDLMLLLKLLLVLAIGNDKVPKEIDDALLSTDDMDMPGASQKGIFPVFRNPHLSRNEQCLLRSISYAKTETGKDYSIRETYLSHLKGVLMVSKDSFVPNTLGGADFDGDIVKVFFNGIIREAVREGVYEKDTGDGRLVRKLPIVDITPYDTKSLRYIFESSARYSTIFNTFSSRVGQISNMAVRRGQRIYASAETEDGIGCAECTILTGLEIDACKTGRHPDLPGRDELSAGLKYDYLSSLLTVINRYLGESKKTSGRTGSLPGKRWISVEKNKKNKTNTDIKYKMTLKPDKGRSLTCTAVETEKGSPLTFLPMIFFNICSKDPDTLKRLGLSAEDNSDPSIDVAVFAFEDDPEWSSKIQKKHSRQYKELKDKLAQYNTQKIENLKRSFAVKNNNDTRSRVAEHFRWRSIRILKEQITGGYIQSDENDALYKTLDGLINLINKGMEGTSVSYPFTDQRKYVKDTMTRLKESNWPFILDSDEEIKHAELIRILGLSSVSAQDLEKVSALFRFRYKGYDLLYCLLLTVFNLHRTGSKPLDSNIVPVPELKDIFNEIPEKDRLMLLYSLPVTGSVKDGDIAYDKDHALVFSVFTDEELVKYLKE